jgi:polar amino acid transport system substrate-binding protein
MTRLLVLLILTLLCIPSVHAIQGSLNVLTEEWGPITFEENGSAQGFAVDVVTAIQSQIKNDTLIQVVPWTRGYHEVQNRPNVVLFTVIRSKEREKLFTLLGPIGTCEVTFYGLVKPNMKIRNIEDAKNVPAIAASDDSLFATILENAGFENIVMTKNPQQEARLLAAGRVDLITNDPLAIETAFKKIGRRDLKLKKYLTLEKGELYIAFSKGTPYPVMQQWQKGLEEIKRNGTFEALVHKWLPTQKPVPGALLVGLESKTPPTKN